MQIADIPLDQIDADALPRDRSLPDPADQDDLVRSIASIGLHQPIELFGIEPDEHHPLPYGLISGYRRLLAFRTLGRTTIPAVLHDPADIPAAMAAMVAENEIRAPLSPWEKGCFLSRLLETQRFAHLDEAIAALYRSATRQQRLRLRNACHVVQEMEGAFVTPERLGQAQIDRLAAAIRAGGAEVMWLTLDRARHIGITLQLQWQDLAPTLNAILAEEPASTPGTHPHNRPQGRPREPRHQLHLRPKLTLKRERTRTGWVIRFYGDDARSPGLVDDVFDVVEEWLGRRG